MAEGVALSNSTAVTKSACTQPASDGCSFCVSPLTRSMISPECKVKCERCPTPKAISPVYQECEHEVLVNGKQQGRPDQTVTDSAYTWGTAIPSTRCFHTIIRADNAEMLLHARKSLSGMTLNILIDAHISQMVLSKRSARMSFCDEINHSH